MTKNVIITGGKGKRLRPLTYEIPKALIPVHGRYLIDHVIDLFWEYNVYENWYTYGYKGNQIKDEYPYLPFFKEDKPMGTGGWLYLIKNDKNLKNQFRKEFFACNGDNLFNLDLHNMLVEHQESDAVVTIACTKVDDVSQYGAVHIEDGWIQSFEEKKKSNQRKPGWINGGYYIFTPEIFEYVPDKTPISLERDIFPEIAKDGKLRAYKSDAQWFDTGTFDRYKDVIKNWNGVRPHDN